MNAEVDLAGLERDLDAVSRRLAPERDWDPKAWHARWLLQGPAIELGWTLLLIVGSLYLGFQNGHSWMVGAALVLLVLPRRWRRARARRGALDAASEGDLFALYTEDLERRFGHLLGRVGVSLALALSFVLFALVVPVPLPSFAVAAVFALRAAFTAAVSIPRNLRLQRQIDGDGESAEADPGEDDEDDESWPRTILGLVGGFLLVFVLYAGPLIAFVATGIAFASDHARRPWILAGSMAAAWVVVFVIQQLRDEEEDA